MKQKVFLYKDVDKLVEKIKNKKVVLVGGCFDIFHFGHLTFFKKAKETGDCLIVILESDRFIKQKKSRQPIHNQKQRGEILSNLEIVDYIVLIPFFKSDSEYFNLVKTVKPSVIAVTNNDPQLLNKKKQAVKVGARMVKVCSIIKEYSTNKIIKIMNSKF